MEEEDCYRKRKSMCRTLELERNLAQAKIQKLVSVAEPNVGPDKAGEAGRGYISTGLWAVVMSLGFSLI